MNFQELGLILQREREAKGLTIEAVMEATKISRINLVALENGDRSSLPHPVYTKGFIKSYARLLGLEADELVMVVDREYQSEDADFDDVAYDVSPSAEKAFQEPEQPTQKKRTAWLSILIFVALASIIVLLVLNLNKGSNDEEKPVESAEVIEQQVAPEQQEEALQPEEQAEDDAAVAEVEQTEAVQQDEESEPAAPRQESAPEASASEQIQQSEAAVPAIQPAVQEDEADQGFEQDGVKYDHVLIIRATTNKGCWIGLWKGDDTKMARDFVLKKGEPLRLMFNNPRRIRIGNVAGVEVTYNGKPYPLEDNTSNIQTLAFGNN